MYIVMLHFHSQTFQFSWKQKLRDRMKFLRRPPSGSHTQNDGPPHKRAKSTSALAQPEDDPKEYEAALKTIQQNAQRKIKILVSLFKTLSCKLNFECPLQAVVCCRAHMIHATTKCLSVIHSFLTTNR